MRRPILLAVVALGCGALGWGAVRLAENPKNGPPVVLPTAPGRPAPLRR